MKMINFILVLLFIFSPSLSINNNDDIINIPFDGKSYSDNYEITKSMIFKIKLDSDEEINEYLKIEVISTDPNKNPNLAIAFCSKNEGNQTCLGDREQLSTGIKSTYLWLTKAQLEDRDNLYFNVLCSDSTCESELKLNAEETIKMDFNSQFNLYVTEKNNQNIDISFVASSENYDYINIWFIGGKTVEVTSNYDAQKYSKNNIYKINKDEINSSFFEFSFKGTPGDIINIGSNSISLTNYNNLIINQPEIKGFLKKEDNIEDCYEFKKDELYMSSNNFYLSGIIYSKIGEVYFRDEQGREIDNSISIIKNGSFIQTIIPNEEIPDYFCIRFPTQNSENYDLTEIFYSLQLTDPSQIELKIGLYSPQIYGEIYPRRLKEGEEYAYIGVVPDDSTKNISINMISQYGFPDMYYRLCKNYPLCTDYEDINPRSISGHTSYKIQKDNISPIGAKQYLLLVKCIEKSNINSVNDYCGFKTSFNSEEDKINLKEGEHFSKYIIKGENDYYKIDYSGEKNIEKAYVNLMVYTGDVNFNAIDLKLEAKKLFNSNKIYYSININDASQDDTKEIYFNVSASKNSFYSIDFIFVRKGDDSWITNMIDPGMSYLITIDPEEKDSEGNKKPYKYVKFTNLKMIDTEELLVQFYSLNCKLNVTAKKINEQDEEYYEEISSFDQYYQDRVYQSTQNSYEYKLYILDTDSSIYNNKLCMVYASSLEMKSNKELNENHLLISDNEPMQVAFKQMEEEIEYLYPHSNPNNDVVINVNPLDPADYEITISFVQKKSSDIVYRRAGNDLIYLIKYEWRNYCKQDEICPIIIKIKLTSTIYESHPKLLISVKTVQENNPNYITKNQAKLDFVLGNNWQFYYTDLGLNEEGNVLVSYRRGSGRLFGKIVKKYETTPEEGANWREMYKFPTTVEESLDFYGYIKKLLIKKEDTSICQDGCYLLLSLKTSIISENDFDFREHPFNIIIHTSSSNQFKDIPIINIPLNEYIIGNLITHNDENIYEYYSTIFTHDSSKIIIDFQSKVVDFYINVGPDNKPTRDIEPDFKFESNGQDTIFEIKKEDFIKKYKERGLIKDNENSLLGLSMTIGLWTNKTDSLYTTVYSMKINLPYDERLIIYEVKSDQKNLCKVENIRGVNRCLFMIYYLGIDALNNIIVYPQIQEHSTYNIFANFIRKEKYDHFDYSDLKDIPNENSKYSTKTTGLDYLYIENSIEDDNFLFVSVETSGKTVELLTSLYTNDLQISPNPSSPQLFAINRDHFAFEFTTEEDVIITIQTLSGKGKICWEVNKDVCYSLEGKDDIIYLTNSLIDKSNKTEVFSNLYIQNESKKTPGFIFYINYLLRPSKINLDEIEIGKSTQIAYRNTDFPVYLYSKLKDLDKDVNIFVNLYELIGINYSELTKESPFEIKAVLVNDTTITNAKMGDLSLNNYVFDFSGSYDSLIKTGFVLITKDDIENKTHNFTDGINVLFKVTKNENYPNLNKNFTRITLEVGIIQEDSDIPVVPNVYHYGKLSLKNEKNIYKLRTDKTTKLMRIHYSKNSDDIRLTISNKAGNDKNTSFDFNEEFINGKYIITFNPNPSVNDYIYLNIFHNNKKSKSEKTTNYVFEYMNGNGTDDFPSIIFTNQDSLELTKLKNGNKYNYTIKFAPLPYKGIDITYLIKFVEKKDYVAGEKANSIALRESNSYVDELKDLKIEDNLLVKEYENINEINYKYVQIIALVKNNSIIEYVGCQNKFVEEEEEESSSNSWKIIIIIIAAIVVLLILIYLLHIYIKKRRNIDKRVENMSGPMVSRISESPVE